MHQQVTPQCSASGPCRAEPALPRRTVRTRWPLFRVARAASRRPANVPACAAQEQEHHRPCDQQHASAYVSHTRRQTLKLVAAIAAAPLMFSSPAEAVLKGGGRGLNRYIKKKSLDPLDTYVPPVLQARQQLQKSGEIMGKDAGSARSLLREGAFEGLRDNIRALGEYAEQNKATQDGSGLVNGFFRALEAYDLRLFEAGRFGRPVAEGTDELLDQAVKSLDRLLETVPADDLSKATEILRVLNDMPSASADNTSSGVGTDAEQRLILPSSKQ